MLEIEQIIADYINKANSKIAEISTIANDLLTKTGCNCDISRYVADINDINSSLYILNKGWENIEETFGYKNYLTVLFPVEDFDPEAATIEIIYTYMDRYEMNGGSVIISPLFPSQTLLGFDVVQTSETDPTVPQHVKDITVQDIDNWNNKVTDETDPTVPEYVKDILELDISNWNSKISVETDPTVPSYVKSILQSDIDFWNDKITTETDPTVPSHVKLISLSDISSWNNKLSIETDPTVPSHVKNITLFDIATWNAKLDTEVDPTVPVHVKNITEIDIDYWNNKITTETDPTVPSYVKNITTTNISNWTQAYNTTLTLTPLFIPRSSFTVLSFNRIGGYIIATNAQPLTATNISLSIGANIHFSRSVIYHQAAIKPTFSGSGVSVTEIGSYDPSIVNEIILFYNGDGRVIIIYTGEAESVSKSLLEKGTVTVTSDTSVNISGFEWEINSTPYSSGVISGIPVTSRPTSGIRIDSFWGDNSGSVVYIQGSNNLNEIFTEYPDRVLLSLFVRKSDEYEHPSYIPIDVTSSVGFVISRVTSDSIGSLTGVETRELSKVDVGLDQVDNTSDINKPISDAVQAALDDLDLVFLRKDSNDNNSAFTLTLGSLTVVNDLVINPFEDLSPVYAIGLNLIGEVVKYSPVTIDDLIKPVQFRYGSEALMLADQPLHNSNYIYYREDEDIYYEYLGTTLGTMVDYNPIGGSGLITASNGLTKSGNDIQLGDQYLSYLPNEDFFIAFTEAGSSLAAYFTTYRQSNVSGGILQANSAKGYSLLELYEGDSTGGVDIAYNPANLTGDFEFSASINYNTNVFSAVIKETINKKGLEYAGDYEANFTPRSLITLQKLTSEILANAYIHPNFTPFTIDTSGPQIIDQLTTTTQGHVSGITLRNLTLADLGYTGATDANNYIHPSYTARNPTLTGALVLASFTSDAIGSVTGITTRTLSTAEIGAININQLGVANGVATLDSGGKLVSSQIPDSLLGGVVYIGQWNASTNTPTLPDPTTVKGNYYIVTVAGTQFGEDFNIGDWVISDGISWEKVDNTDAVMSVFGRIGNVVALASDYSGFYVRHDINTQGLSGTNQGNARTNINAEQVIIGGATTITQSNLTINRALISNASGKVAVSAVTSTELGYVGGVTSSIQTQLNTKLSANQVITLSGDVTGSGATSIATTISNDAVTTTKILNSNVTYAKIQNVSANRILGQTATTSIVKELTPAEVRTIINVADGANNYVHPNHSGDVVSVADGVTTIQPTVVTYAKIQNVTADRMLGRLSTLGSVQELTATQVRTFLNIEDNANAYIHPPKAWVDKTTLSGATVIANLTIDSLGHPTDWVTRNLTPANIGAEPSFTKGSIIQGVGMTLAGTLTSRLVGTGDITINHADTSAITGSFGTKGIASLIIDGFGHVTAINTETFVTSTATANYIPKMSDSSTITNSLFYELNGKIGLFTTNPVYDLHLLKSNNNLELVSEQISTNRFASNNVLSDVSGASIVAFGSEYVNGTGARWTGRAGVYINTGKVNQTFNVWIGTKTIINSLPTGETAIGQDDPMAWLDIQGNLRIGTVISGTGNILTINTSTGIVTSQTPTQVLSNIGGEPVIAPGTTLQYFRGDKTWQILNTSVVPELTNLYFTEARVRATLLTGYTVGANTALAATDSILGAFEKVQGQINARGLSTADITDVSLTTTTLTLTRVSGNLTATVPVFNQNTTGSAATLTTPRTFTIGSTGKSFNGSANVSWSLAEIGAQAAGNYVTTDTPQTINADKTFGSTNHITFGPNTTWSSYLRIGGNGRTVANDNAWASIATTNGNIHIDAGTTRGTYLNYHSGTAGVNFGNGAGAIVAVMGSDGDLWKGSGDNIGSQYFHSGNHIHRTDAQNDTYYLPLGGYSFTNGFLIATDIPADQSKMFVLRVKGNGYFGNNPFDIVLQGYNDPVNNAITSVKAHSIGANPTIQIFNYNGFVYFHIPQINLFQSILAEVYDTMVAPRYNRVTAVTNTAVPSSGVTRLISITPKKVWSENEISQTFIDNWNTAYSWGNHAGLYAAVSHTHPASQITAGTFGAGTYTMDTLLLGGQITASSAKIQVNGFQLTGGLIIHGHTTPTSISTSVDVAIQGELMNIGSNLHWDGSRIYQDNYHPDADKWTIARTITIGATGKSVDGSANVAWSLAEIGASTVGSNLFTLVNPSAIRFIRINADNTVTALSATDFRDSIGAGTSSTFGTVTSVAMSVPTGLTVVGSPITTSGTLSVSLQAGYSIPTTAKQTEWDTAYTNRITSLTTTGNSGAATLLSNVLNIPNYTLAGLGGIGGTIASDQVAFGTGANTIGGSSSFTYDDTLKELRIGSGPTSINVAGNGTTSSQINFLRGNVIEMSITKKDTEVMEFNTDVTVIGTLGGYVWRNQGVLIMSLLGNGNLGILTNAPTNTLDVNGTTRVRILANATGNFVTTSATGVLQQRTAAEVRGDLALDTNYVTIATNQTITGAKTFSSLILGSVNGNAGTATILQTARLINGTSFDGSADITTEKWGTARTITIGATGKSVDGSANVAWSLAEINVYSKEESDPLASTGSVIEFDRPRTYNGNLVPNTNATLTESNTNFRKVTQVIFHQAASLTVPASWALSTGSDEYDPAKVNIIYVEAFDADYKRYIIDHDE